MMTARHEETRGKICQNCGEEFADNLVDGEASSLGQEEAAGARPLRHPEPPPKV